MPFGHIHGSPGVVVTRAKPSRLYAADGVTLKQLVQGQNTRSRVYQNAAADGDRMQMFFYARGNETFLDMTTDQNTDRAIWDLYINGVLDSAGYDDYGASDFNVWHIILTQPIKTGYNVIELRANGKNALSTSYIIAVVGASIS